MSAPHPSRIVAFLILVIAGAAGGFAAQAAGLPLPFMLGGLVGGLAAILTMQRFAMTVDFPKPLRIVFVAVIGAMIGGTFTPELVALIPVLPVTLTAMVFFVVVAHAAGYAVCRTVGNYDRPTAFFATMPGGLVEGISLGEQSGGDVRILTLHHFTRVIFVAVAVPLVFWIWSGEVVGSAAGQSMSRGTHGLLPPVIVCAIAGAGLLLGRVVHMPAGHLLGPMVLAAALQGSGMIEVAGPTWLLALGQLMIGVGLAGQVTGTTLTLAGKIVAISLTSVSLMLAIGVGFALVLSQLSDLDLPSLILSFAPGGVVEMGLIALSLHLSPVVVATHHIFRIFLAVFVAAIGLRRFRRQGG